MTERDAIKIMNEYRMMNGETGEEYSYEVVESCGKSKGGGCYYLRCNPRDCTIEDKDELPVFAVFSDGDVIMVPT